MAVSQAVLTPTTTVPSATPRHSHSVLARYSGSTVAARCAHTVPVPPCMTLNSTLPTGKATSAANTSEAASRGWPNRAS